MDVPSLHKFREAVDHILNPRDALLVKAIYLTCCRPSEILTKVNPWELEHGRVKLAYGTYVKVERLKTFDYQDRRHKVLVIKMAVAKRKKKGKKAQKDQKMKLILKVIALPCDPRYEPWTEDLIKYIGKRGTLNFDLSRDWVNDLIKNSQLRKLDPHVVTKSLRHYRITHLLEEYNFDPTDIICVTGWTFKSGLPKFGIAGGQFDTYAHLRWKKYFPKLLIPL